MKKYSIVALMGVALFAPAMALVSCSLDDNDDNFADDEEWQKQNTEFYTEQANRKNTDGTSYYEKIIPQWDANASVLIHYFTKGTTGLPAPMLTSTVDVKYRGHLINNVAFDSSYLATSPGDSIYRTSLSNVIAGWQIALANMHPGDSAEVIIPSDQGYGSTATSNIPANSTLIFNVKLVDIVSYEIPEPRQ